MSARVVAIEGAISVEEVIFRDEAAVDVAVLQGDGGLFFLMDVWHLLAGTFADGGLEDVEGAVDEEDAAAVERGVAACFVVQEA